jgi:protein transport protein HofQ/type IV pilus assembly protein PilQ
MKWRAAILASIFAVVPVMGFASPAINIDVHDADIVDVLRLLGAQARVNLVPDGSLRHDRISLHLQNVTFEETINALARAYELQIRKEGSVLLVGAGASMNRRFGESNNGALGTHTKVFHVAYARAEDLVKPLFDALVPGTVVIADHRTSSIVVTGSSSTIERATGLIAAFDSSLDLTPGRSIGVVPLRYVKASDALKLLKGLVPDGAAVADDRQNVVLVNGAQDTAQTVRGFIAQIDRPSRQVMFEVKVIDMTPQNDSSNVGIQFGGVDLTGEPSAGATSFTFARSSLQLNATLNFMVSKGRAKILATPRLVTLNSREASLLIGETYPIIYFDIRSGNQQIQTIDIGVKLRMTPTIGADGSIVAELHPEYSEIQGFQQSYPVIANRKVDSTLRVADGETIVLGGLLREITSETVTKLPLLSDVPILGEIFKNRQRTAERDEIVFLITPHIVQPGKESS